MTLTITMRAGRTLGGMAQTRPDIPNRIEAQFQALRYFTLDGTDHASHREQASMIRRYIIERNRNAHDQALRDLVKRANVA